MNDLKSYIRDIPDFPQKGIIFRDITSLLQDAKGFGLAIQKMEAMLENIEFDIIVGAESRGFIFGAPIAYNLKKSFVPVRKKGKLPCETMEETYQLEYGQATLEIHKDAIAKGQKVVIIDDLIATGGTLEAIVKLVERLGGKIEKICCLIELPELNGREKLKDYPIETAVSFEGK